MFGGLPCDSYVLELDLEKKDVSQRCCVVEV